MPRDRDDDLVRINLRPVSTPDLKPDLSNYGEVGIAKFKRALQGTDGTQLRFRTLAFMQKIAEAGTGIDPTQLPRPLAQSHLECQTLTLLNGVQAWVGYDAVRGLVPQIPEIRRRAIELREGNTRGAESMLAVSDVLQERGVLERSNLFLANPIQAVRELFADHRFMGVASEDRYHAFAVLPIEQTPASRAAALKVDSLGGRVSTLSMRDLLNLIIDINPSDNHMIFEATRRADPKAPETTPAGNPPNSRVLSILERLRRRR